MVFGGGCATAAIGLKPMVLRVKVPRWLNTTTGEEFSSPPFAEAYTKITRKLGCLIVDLARVMTLSDIAGWLRLSRDTVKAVVKGRLEKDYRRIGTAGCARSPLINSIWGARENTSRWSWTWRVLVSSGGGEGRGAEALREFWRRFKLSGARL